MDTLPQTFTAEPNTDNSDQYGWPLPDPETEAQLSIMYGALVNARREREQAIARLDAPARAIVI